MRQLQQEFELSVDFFDALQTEQADLPHGARRVFRREVKDHRSVCGFGGSEGTNHAEQEVVMRSGWEKRQQNLVETEV